ncbi:pirin family protein [Gilvimarinus polysaccharolyticus]|uniref:pirin family protein n=1 Tax=Gilvimarinus polysaccharolyticus TaxID=863921 RepID=UPI0006732F9F|nr:pirin family protein [Gilvimarinus polysaccharolyticus]
MSRLTDTDPDCRRLNEPEAPVETIIIPNMRDIGDFSVRRVLPAPARRAVGPFIFFDHMGPTTFAPGHGLDICPHPHIGLSTLTYLYEGSILHRDSLGFKQLITPGAINWMTAGRGIVHSERSSEQAREQGQTLMGLQMWVALPKALEQCAAQFQHYSVSSLPELAADGVKVRVVAGECFGVHARLETHSSLFYADITVEPGRYIKIDADYIERAIYLVQGVISVDDCTFGAGQMLVLKPGAEIIVHSSSGAAFAVIGGEPLDGPRHLWWNFVASDRELIEQAKADWRDGKFGRVPGDNELIPLPES